jgi:glycine cleavage system H protein
VGITDFAQDQLGDVVFVQLPEVGTTVSAKDPVGEVESTKSVSEIYAPLAGEITAVNEALGDSPELINSDPFGEGWMFELRIGDEAALGELLDSAAYGSLTGQA